VLSFTRPLRRDTTVPSARTASRPTTWARIGPYRSTCKPPALVATMPPTVALSRAARSTGKSSPALSAVSCRRASVTPAPTVTWAATVSTGSKRVSRTVLSTTTGSAPDPATARAGPPRHQPGIAALHHDADPALGADPYHRRHLIGRSRAHDEQGGAAEPPRPVGLEWRSQFGVDEHVRRTDDVGEGGRQRAVGHGTLWHNGILADGPGP